MPGKKQNRTWQDAALLLLEEGFNLYLKLILHLWRKNIIQAKVEDIILAQYSLLLLPLSDETALHNNGQGCRYRLVYTVSKVDSVYLNFISSTWEVLQWHVGVAVMSNTDHHSIKNVFLLFAILVLRLNIPLAWVRKIGSLLQLQDFGLNNRKTETDISLLKRIQKLRWGEEYISYLTIYYWTKQHFEI